MSRVHSIRGGIAPSPYAGVGANVIRAIAGYAGQPRPAPSWRSTPVTPFTEQMRFTIAPPVACPCATPCSRWSMSRPAGARQAVAQAKTIWMGAGPVPELLHRGLIALAWVVRWRLLQSLLPSRRCSIGPRIT
jgi:hypothetical protein